ncbi:MULTISPECIES: ice-binding family protein [unclassified Modestobacter]
MASVPSTLPSTRRFSRAGVATSLVAVSGLGLWAGLSGTAQAATAVPLGDAQSFAVLAGAGITNTGATTVTGDIGSFSTTTIDGGITLAPGSTNHGGDSVTQDAKTALTNALTIAANATPRTPVAAGELGGLDLSAGVYNSSGSTLDLTGTLTLDGGGSYDSVFIFQATSDLITAGNSTVALTNGAQACNVFWQVTSSATLGGNSDFVGTILADTAITLGTLARVEGRVLASTAAVSLDTNVITRPDTCRTGAVTPVVVTPPPPAPPTSTPTDTPGPTATPTGTPGPTATPTGTPAPTATPSGSAPATAPSAGRTSGSTTYGQVGRVPVGAVDTGDGSTLGEHAFRTP